MSTKRINVTTILPPSALFIGYVAENGVTNVEFDVSAWVAMYGSGTATLIMKRWGDANPYPIALAVDNEGLATWTISATDTAKKGFAYAQLRYEAGTKVKKSPIYTLKIGDSLGSPAEAPDQYEDWIDALTHIAAQAMAEVLDIEGIVTDKTLTVDGGIADAKATGDALALKANQATTYTKTEVDAIIESVDVETDTTLEVAGAAADSKKVGDELAAIKADLGAQSGCAFDNTESEKVITFVTGKYIATNGDTANINTVTSNASYAYVVLNCTEGDVFTITGSGGATPRLYAFLGAEANGVRPVIEKAKASQTIRNVYITAPANAEKLVVNASVNYGYALYRGKRIANVWSEVADNKSDILRFERAILFPNLADPSKYTVGYKTNTGSTGSNSTYKYTGKIAVSYGDTLYLSTPSRYICAYDASDGVASAAGSSTDGVMSYEVPEGIASVQITFYASNESAFMVTKISGLEYMPYGAPIINRDALPETIVPHKLNYYSVKGSLSAGEHLIIEKKIPIKNGSVVQFSGNIVGEFSGLEFGYTSDISDADSTHFKVDSTKYYRVTSSPAESEHSLTMSGNVSITLTQTYTHLLIDIICNGQKYHTSSGWSPLHKYVYVKALSAMDDCVLSFTATTLRKDIVIFGDSYVSYGESRWVYYLSQDERDGHISICGYSGESSEYGYQSFIDLMPITDAQYVVWAYGMNDHDTSNAANATWKAKIDAVIVYCNAHGITPVLCTIPNVPSYSNNYKNAYVRTFIGTYPVIDFAKAVGSDVSSSWYDGYLSDDNVHPTAVGAKALYNRAIADFPQLCVN